MTESEAIKVLNMIETHGALPTMAKAKSIEALEKQIPKKPKTDNRYVMHICPWCNDFVKVSHNYCQNCGQKLNWESESE